MRLSHHHYYYYYCCCCCRRYCSYCCYCYYCCCYCYYCCCCYYYYYYYYRKSVRVGQLTTCVTRPGLSCHISVALFTTIKLYQGWIDVSITTPLCGDRLRIHAYILAMFQTLEKQPQEDQVRLILTRLHRRQHNVTESFGSTAEIQRQYQPVFLYSGCTIRSKARTGKTAHRIILRGSRFGRHPNTD